MTVDGVVYESVKEASLATGLSRGTIEWKSRRGHQDIPLTPSPGHVRSVTIDGVAYKSVTAAARALGTTTGKIRRRLHGPLVKPNATGRPVTIDGVEYVSMAAAAKALGVTVWIVQGIVRSQRKA